MIDTGNNVTCIQEKWLTENRSLLGEMDELPLTCVHIITAMRKKIRRVSKIVMFMANLGKLMYEIQMLMVPELIKEAVIRTGVM